MTRDEFNTHCAAKPGTAHVVQWGGSDVWKVGGETGKVFALCGWHEGHEAFSFKVSEMLFDLLRAAPGYRPAPYLASRGLTWLQIHAPAEVEAAQIADHIDASYEMIAAKLTRKARAAHGIEV